MSAKVRFDGPLAGIEIESSHTIEIESFVPRSSADPVYFDKCYYIAPDDKVGEEAFAIMRETIRKRDAAGIGRAVLYGRERMILLEPRSKGILGTALHYDYEVRDDAAYFEPIPEFEIGKELLDLADHIIHMKFVEFDPAKFKDRYQEAVAHLAAQPRCRQTSQSQRSA
jgi:DNA end-binding protein Ku